MSRKFFAGVELRDHVLAASQLNLCLSYCKWWHVVLQDYGTVLSWQTLLHAVVPPILLHAPYSSHSEISCDSVVFTLLWADFFVSPLHLHQQNLPGADLIVREVKRLFGSTLEQALCLSLGTRGSILGHHHRTISSYGRISGQVKHAVSRRHPIYLFGQNSANRKDLKESSSQLLHRDPAVGVQTIRHTADSSQLHPRGSIIVVVRSAVPSFLISLGKLAQSIAQCLAFVKADCSTHHMLEILNPQSNGRVSR